MNVGLYARVSTHDQHTLLMQTEALHRYAKQREWFVALEIKDIASGNSEHPQRESLLKAAKKREIDVILVWRLDRWGRSVTDLVSTLTELSQLGVGFISITEALDLTTATGRAMAGLLAVFAEFERDLLRERVKAGIAHAKKLGKPHGRPKTAAYYKDQAITLFQQGVSKSKIAKELNISRTSVRRLVIDCNLETILKTSQSNSTKIIKVNLWLRVENNNKFVRGKSKVREDIEYYILSEYEVKKLYKDGCEYELAISYENDEDLDETIYSMLNEMSHTADMRNCFIEADIRSIDGKKSW